MRKFAELVDEDCDDIEVAGRGRERVDKAHWDDLPPFRRDRNNRSPSGRSCDPLFR